MFDSNADNLKVVNVITRLRSKKELKVFSVCTHIYCVVPEPWSFRFDCSLKVSTTYVYTHSVCATSYFRAGN